MELTYHRNGDYLFPNLVIGKIAEGSEEPIGKYGRLRKAYLKEHRGVHYSGLLIAGKLEEHLRQVDRDAEARLDEIVNRFLMNHPAPDKAQDQMGWVQHMNQLNLIAEETVLEELVYS